MNTVAPNVLSRIVTTLVLLLALFTIFHPLLPNDRSDVVGQAYVFDAETEDDAGGTRTGGGNSEIRHNHAGGDHSHDKLGLLPQVELPAFEPDVDHPRAGQDAAGAARPSSPFEPPRTKLPT